MKANSQKTKKVPKYLRHPENGRVYPWTPALAARNDLVPCDEDPAAVAEVRGEASSMYPEERRHSKLMASIDKLRDAMAVSRQNAAEAPEQIAALTERLGDAVFQAAMGEIDPDEPTRIRAEIARLQVAEEDARYVGERAAKREISLQAELQKLSRRRARRSELLELQRRLTEELDAVKDDSLIRRMRDLAEALDGSTAAVDKLVAKLSMAVSSGSTAKP